MLNENVRRVRLNASESVNDELRTSWFVYGITLTYSLIKMIVMSIILGIEWNKPCDLHLQAWVLVSIIQNIIH